MTKEETWATLVASGVAEGKSTRTQWNLREANLSEADLGGADLSGADLRGTNLSGANLREGYFSQADFSGANFRGANLAFAYLAGVNLRGADLTDAILTAAVLIRTDLTKANLSGACIDNATISECVIKDISCSHIREATSGKPITIGFEPQAFEKKHPQMRATAEIVLYPSGDTSMTDLQQLIEKYEKRMAELEAQIEELRHKHDILVEASRLLEEEAQISDVSRQ